MVYTRKVDITKLTLHKLKVAKSDVHLLKNNYIVKHVLRGQGPLGQRKSDLIKQVTS